MIRELCQQCSHGKKNGRPAVQPLADVRQDLQNLKTQRRDTTKFRTDLVYRVILTLFCTDLNSDPLLRMVGTRNRSSVLWS